MSYCRQFVTSYPSFTQFFSIYFHPEFHLGDGFPWNSIPPNSIPNIICHGIPSRCTWNLRWKVSEYSMEFHSKDGIPSWKWISMEFHPKNGFPWNSTTRWNFMEFHPKFHLIPSARWNFVCMEVFPSIWKMRWKVRWKSSEYSMEFHLQCSMEFHLILWKNERRVNLVR